MIRSMRQSLLSSWTICGRRAWYSMHGDLPYATSQAAAMGTAHHSGMELVYRETPDDNPRVVTPALRSKAYGAAIASFDLEVERAEDRFRWDGDRDDALNIVIARLDLALDRLLWQGRVLAVEKSFTHGWRPGWTAHGTIDLVLLAFDQAIGVDHKTAYRRWAANKRTTLLELPQAGWYMDAWDAENPATPMASFTFDIVSGMGNSLGVERRVLAPTPDERSRVRSLFTEAALAMDALDAAGVDYPANPGHMLCSDKYCDAWDHCPYGAMARTQP